MPLFFLLERRLDKKYRTLESFGAGNSGMVQAISGNSYTPNPRATSFDLEQLLQNLTQQEFGIRPDKQQVGVRGQVRLRQYEVRDSHVLPIVTPMLLTAIRGTLLK